MQDHRIAPFRGDYFVLAPEARPLVHGLIYPVPDPSFPFLGVHFTRRVDDEVWAGPNAVPAFAREGYGRFKVDLRDAHDLLVYRGLWRLARRYLRTGAAEAWRDVVKLAAVRQMRRYLPDLSSHDVALGPCGIRAQVLSRDGMLVDDFLLRGDSHVLHVLNAPSPAATASLAIGSRLAEHVTT
jgi:L-2-hydroxyglutarate oxidase LhgO